MIQKHKIYGIEIEIEWEQGELIEKHEYGADYAIAGIDNEGEEYHSQAFIFDDEWEIDEDFIKELETDPWENRHDPDDAKADRDAINELRNPYKI